MFSSMAAGVPSTRNEPFQMAHRKSPAAPGTLCRASGICRPCCSVPTCCGTDRSESPLQRQRAQCPCPKQRKALAGVVFPFPT